jgi:hypothetical protein
MAICVVFASALPAQDTLFAAGFPPGTIVPSANAIRPDAFESGREFTGDLAPESALTDQSESHTSMPPCLVHARFRSLVAVKNPS